MSAMRDAPPFEAHARYAPSPAHPFKVRRLVVMIDGGEVAGSLWERNALVSDFVASPVREGFYLKVETVDD